MNVVVTLGCTVAFSTWAEVCHFALCRSTQHYCNTVFKKGNRKEGENREDMDLEKNEMFVYANLCVKSVISRNMRKKNRKKEEKKKKKQYREKRMLCRWLVARNVPMGCVEVFQKHSAQKYCFYSSLLLFLLTCLLFDSSCVYTFHITAEDTSWTGEERPVLPDPDQGRP